MEPAPSILDLTGTVLAQDVVPNLVHLRTNQPQHPALHRLLLTLRQLALEDALLDGSAEAQQRCVQPDPPPVVGNIIGNYHQHFNPLPTPTVIHLT